jgi:hypothetical protein
MNKKGGALTETAPVKAKKTTVKKPVVKVVKTATASKSMAAIAAKVQAEKLNKTTTTPATKPAIVAPKTEDKTEKKIESLAMIHQVHGENKTIKKSFLGKTIKLKRLSDATEKNWTLWCLTWSIMWRSAIIIFLLQFVILCLKLIALNYFVATM